MNNKKLKRSVRHVLTVSHLFTQTRLDVLLISPVGDGDETMHFKVNPHYPFSKLPVLDRLTMSLVRRIFEIMKVKIGKNHPIVMVAGHYDNGTPKYFTSTEPSIYAKETARLLHQIGKDTLDNHQTVDIFTYIRRLRQRTKSDIELIKRVLNAYALTNLIIEEARRESAVIDKTSYLKCTHEVTDQFVW